MDGVWSVLDSPVGELLLTGNGRALTGVFFTDHRGGADARADRAQAGAQTDQDAVLRAAAEQLEEYFDLARKSFELPTAPHGTPFQHRVWGALREVDYGETVSYGEIARRLDLSPAAARAVGLANGANPLSIVVPCHRVVGADGSLTGYGGGLERKQYLLDLERGSLF